MGPSDTNRLNSDDEFATAAGYFLWASFSVTGMKPSTNLS